MAKQWTRRQVLTQMGIAAAAVHTLDPHELCCTVSAHAQTADKDLFELKKVGDGVYGAIAATRYKVNCNAAVIMTDDGVIVVDSHSKPSASRAVYTQIQGITKKPVLKVINTHFHWDHWQGNEVYSAGNPKLEIIATQKTKENLTKPDAGVGGVPYIEKQLAALPGEIEKLKGDILKESDADKKRNLESNLQQAESFMQELKQMKPALPTRTVTTTVTLKEQGREIQLHVLGRGHTDGDLYIYMPKEKDIVPGHGDVLPKSHLTFFRSYLSELIAAVKKASADGATLAEMQTKIGDQLASKYEAGMSKYPLGRYRDRIGQNVEMVHKKVVKKA